MIGKFLTIFAHINSEFVIQRRLLRLGPGNVKNSIVIRVNSFLNDVSTSNVAMKKVQRLGGPVITPRDSQGIKENWVVYESNGVSPY